jgi:hypothetical protein
MRRTVRSAVAIAAVTATAGLGLVAAGPASAAPATCPTGKYCLYDGANYTDLLIATDARWVEWIGAAYNDRVSSVINNSGETLHLFKHANMDGVNGSFTSGTRYSFTGQFDNTVSSYYLY